MGAVRWLTPAGLVLTIATACQSGAPQTTVGGETGGNHGSAGAGSGGTAARTTGAAGRTDVGGGAGGSSVGGGAPTSGAAGTPAAGGSPGSTGTSGGSGGGSPGEVGGSPMMACGVREFGDQGDGTYVNRILPGDYQNTDVVRVGNDYYYITATKSLSPGMQVLHSNDLVNWTAIGHVVNDITVFSSGFNYDKMQNATGGIWAGSIAYHAGSFYVYFTTPDEGLYVSSATNPAGPWSPLVRMVQGAGWDDPAPFWDDDGQGYLAMTRFAADPATGKTYNIHLYELSADGKALVANWDHIIYQGPGSEANKLYKINGYYYHFFSQLTGEGRVPFTSRAQVITGPWETPHQLIHVSAANGEPNQGAILQTAGGDWVFITHHGNAVWYGRGASLLPVTWTNGWPEAGKVGSDGIGNMVSSAPKPVLGYPITAPQTDDDFSSPVLGPQWEWFFQPRPDKWSLTERPGFLRLHAFKPLAAGDLSKTGNVLTQRPLGAAHNVATVTMDISNMADGQIAGLGFLGNAWAAVGVQQEKGVRHFVYSHSGQAIVNGPALAATQTTVGLRTSWNAAAAATFSVSTDLTTYAPLGSTFTITNFGNYIGAKLAIYTGNDQQEAGYVDVDSFTYPCTAN
jgi:beta-xylosidase